MEQLLTWFEPQPSEAELPRALNSPFDSEGPPAIAVRAALEVQEALGKGSIGGGLSTQVLQGPEGGKMFGVLVVRSAGGRVGYLKSFSGQLQRAWEVEGFVPPVFDRAARARVEPPGERVVKQLTARVEEDRCNTRHAEVAAQLRMLLARHEAERAALKDKHQQRRAHRHSLRAQLGPLKKAALHALDEESRSDDAELRKEKARWRAELGELERLRKRLTRRSLALERLRRFVSQKVSWQIYETYEFVSARGQRRSLRGLWAPKVPSSGTGDCAAPKLLAYALSQKLQPLALAEFWWGAPPPGGGRKEGSFYPACKDKCGPLLPFLLDGLTVDAVRRYRPPDLKRLELPVVFEDEWLLVVDKPEGLLSVPGTDASVKDSVLERMRERFPGATGPLLVHRLDVETSGLLLVAKNAQAHTALQKQFIEREVRKCYIAVLDGDLEREEGVIELPLRVDLEQRPRQLVDFEHGKPALTRFRVVERAPGRTRVAFFPETGRTHQLRVHASHPRGLGIPILGDRLYGTPAARLFLHAESLQFRHPSSGAPVTFRSAASF